MASSASLLKTLRQIHLYLGVFIAPALLFFSFTGAMQTIGLHEEIRGSSYKPPKILAALGQLHKKQTLNVPGPRPQATPGAERPREAPVQPAAAAKKEKNVVPMKLFFLIVSAGLFTSTLTGLYMAYKYDRNARLITALWVGGVVIPVLCALF